MDFNAKDPNAWADRKAQGLLGEQTANQGPLIFSNYPAVDLSSAPSIHQVLYPPGSGNFRFGGVNFSGVGGLGNLGGLGGLGGFGAGSGSLGNAGMGANTGTGNWAWRPDMPVSAQQAQLLDQQPASSFGGIVNPQWLGLGRINFDANGNPRPFVGGPTDLMNTGNFGL